MKSTIACTLLLATLPAVADEHAPTVLMVELTHIHGVVLPRGSQDILLATHTGLFAVDAAGNARMVSAEADDFMGFTSSPDGRLYASGHPRTGGNTGIVSADGADAPWMMLADGADGPVDFHAMTVSPADPAVMYGSYGGVQVSKDGGKTWTVAGPGPDDLVDLAAAMDKPGHLYAATMKGLSESPDYGASWTTVGNIDGPVSAVETASDGELYAFVVGSGLHRLEGADLLRVGRLTDKVIVHMAFDPTIPELAVAVTADSEVLSSTDRGRSWSSFVP